MPAPEAARRLAANLEGAEVIINGMPFAGTGTGGFVGGTGAALRAWAERPLMIIDEADAELTSFIRELSAALSWPDR